MKQIQNKTIRNLKQVFCMMSAMVHCGPAMSCQRRRPFAQVDAATMTNVGHADAQTMTDSIVNAHTASMTEADAPIHNHLEASSSSAGAVAITGTPGLPVDLQRLRLEQAANLRRYIPKEMPEDIAVEYLGHSYPYRSTPRPTITQREDGTWELVDRLFLSRCNLGALWNDRTWRILNIQRADEDNEGFALLVEGYLEMAVSQMSQVIDNQGVMFYNGKSRKPLPLTEYYNPICYGAPTLRELRNLPMNSVYLNDTGSRTHLRVKEQEATSYIRVTHKARSFPFRYREYIQDDRFVDVLQQQKCLIGGRDLSELTAEELAAVRREDIKVIVKLTAKADHPEWFTDLELLYQLLLAPAQNYEGLCSSLREMREFMSIARHLQKEGKWVRELTPRVCAFLRLPGLVNTCPRLYSAVAEALEHTQ